MFGKRKYERKKGTRKSFRRSVRKKGKVLKPAEPAPIVEKPVFNAAGLSLYLWMHIPPIPQKEYDERHSETRRGFTKSLRAKCAEVVGANADVIVPSYLEEGLWSCWSAVWLAILKNGADLPDLFRTFAQRFGDQFTFACHLTSDTDMRIVHASLRDLRDTALNAYLIPFSRKHRVENIFSNVSLKDLVTFVGGLQPASVVLDCSKMPPLSAAGILTLCNIPTLKGLDLSGNRQIDDQLLYTIKTRLVLRESSLQFLIISGCPHVTNDGLFDLLESCGSSNLSYVESDIRLTSLTGFEQLFSKTQNSTNAEVVTGTNWKLVQKEDQLQKVSKYKLGFKYHILLKQLNKVSTTGILWDLKFFPAVLESLEKAAEHSFVSAWKQRYLDAVNKPLEPPFMYIKDENITITPRPVAVEATMDPPIFERAGHAASAKKQGVKRNIKKKRNTISTSVDTFFFGA